MKRLTALVAGAVLAVSLTGCMRVQTDIVLNDDDTMSIKMLMAVEDATIEDLGLSADDFLAEMESEAGGDLLVPGMDSEAYKQDGYTGYLYTAEDAPLSDFSDDVLSFTREGDEYVVTGALENDDLGFTQTDLDNFDSLGLGAPDITFTVTFPGKVTDSNGVIDGNTVTWTYVVGETLEFDARGDAGGSGSTVVDPTDDATDATEDATDTATDDATTEASDEPSAEATTSSDDEGVNWLLWVGIGIGVLALAGLAAWLVARNRKGGNGPGGPGAYAAAGAPAWGQQPGQQQYGQGTDQWGQPSPQGQPQQPGQPGQGQQWGQPDPNQQPGQQWGQPTQQQPGQPQWGQPQQPGQGQSGQGQPGQQWGQPDQSQQQAQPWGQPQQPGQPGQPGQQWGQPGTPGDEPPAQEKNPWR